LGVTAAFGAASCCALPLLLGSLGVGSAWLITVASFAAPHRLALLGVAVACLAGGGGMLLWRRRRAARCASGACGTPVTAPVVTSLLLLRLGDLAMAAAARPERQNLGREFQGERVGAAALQGVRFRPADVSRPPGITRVCPDATVEVFRRLSDKSTSGSRLPGRPHNARHRPSSDCSRRRSGFRMRPVLG
jgi:mercuric ion transport protein